MWTELKPTVAFRQNNEKYFPRVLEYVLDLLFIQLYPVFFRITLSIRKLMS